jgi:hypothetical protein
MGPGDDAASIADRELHGFAERAARWIADTDGHFQDRGEEMPEQPSRSLRPNEIAEGDAC